MAKKAIKKSGGKRKSVAATKATPVEKAAPKVGLDYEGKTITSNIARIVANDEAQQSLVHSTALACVCQIMVHRNADYASRLLNKLGKHWRTASFVKWLGDFTPVSYQSSKNKDTGATTRKFTVLKEDDPKWIKMKAAFVKDADKYLKIPTFWDYDPEKEDYRGVDLIAIIDRAIKQAEGANVYPKSHPKAGQPLSEEDAKKNNLLGLAELRAVRARLTQHKAQGEAAGVQ
jgi:hypothetical protein